MGFKTNFKAVHWSVCDGTLRAPDEPKATDWCAADGLGEIRGVVSTHTCTLLFVRTQIGSAPAHSGHFERPMTSLTIGQIDAHVKGMETPFGRTEKTHSRICVPIYIIKY